MEVTGSAARVRDACDAARSGGATVGFVPTMGALHAGHRALLDRARSECGFVAMSIFVNPLQFGEARDLAAYPRTFEADHGVAECAGCDLLFAPDGADMFPNGRPEVTVDPGPIGGRLEGASRPDHFRGVLTVVAKLFHLVGPCRAYFGEKDAQQLALIRRMVHDLDVPAEAIGCPTVRDPDGLAVSSRNVRLSIPERAAALSLSRALAAAANAVGQGERSADVLRAEMARRIGAEPLARLDYVGVVDERTWEEVTEIGGPARALVAARVGDVRLIDNVALVWDGDQAAR